MAELVNKINGPWFSKFDEDLATAFSIYCGISIAHVCTEGSSTWRVSHTRWAPSSATAQRDGDGGGCVFVVPILWGQVVVAMGWEGN